MRSLPMVEQSDVLKIGREVRSLCRACVFLKILTIKLKVVHDTKVYTFTLVVTSDISNVESMSSMCPGMRILLIPLIREVKAKMVNI